MATTAKLKIAEILADLSDLRVVEPNGAMALVRAHRSSETPCQNSQRPIMKSKSSSRGSTPMRMTREETPGLEIDASGAVDEDLQRAKVLLKLYESRGQAQHTENQALTKSRERVDKIAERFGVSN